MKKYVLVVAVAAALFSCSGNPKADATQTDKNKQETAQVPDMHNAETSLDYWGVYEGTLPAASSPGIKTTLTLNKDKTFTLRSEYIDEKDGIFNDKGTYTLDGNILTAKQEGGENRNRLASRFSRSGGVYFFAFSGKDTKRKKSRNVFIL